MVKPKKNLMVIRLSAMGDVAMMVPVLSALYQKYPEVSITVLTRPFFAPFFRALPNVSVFPVEVYGRHKGILGLYKLSMELKELKIDAIVDLHNVIRSKILRLFFFTKRIVKMDKGRAEKKDLVSGKIFNQLKTTHQRYVDSFKTLGFQIDLSNPIFPKKVVLSQKLIAITGLNPSSKKIIGIAPFAAHEGKKYPLELMEEVIASLSKTHKIVLFGASKIEAPILNTLEARFENVVSVAGKLTLDEELDVISNLNVMLSMDSGNAHLAAMLGIKVVTIWGVTHPYAGFMPFNQPDDYALLSNRKLFPKIPTSIYGNKCPEGYEKASASIAPKVVIEKINSII